MPGKPDGEGQAAVEKICPVPWNRLCSEDPTALLEEKTVKITVDQKEPHHTQSCRNKEPGNPPCPC